MAEQPSPPNPFYEHIWLPFLRCILPLGEEHLAGRRGKLALAGFALVPVLAWLLRVLNALPELPPAKFRLLHEVYAGLVRGAPPYWQARELLSRAALRGELPATALGNLYAEPPSHLALGQLLGLLPWPEAAFALLLLVELLALVVSWWAVMWVLTPGEPCWSPRQLAARSLLWLGLVALPLSLGAPSPWWWTVQLAGSLALLWARWLPSPVGGGAAGVLLGAAAHLNPHLLLVALPVAPRSPVAAGVGLLAGGVLGLVPQLYCMSLADWRLGWWLSGLKSLAAAAPDPTSAVPIELSLPVLLWQAFLTSPEALPLSLGLALLGVWVVWRVG